MAHAHRIDQTYYLDQLCTIGACAAVGGVAIMQYVMKTPLGEPRLSYILAPGFFPWVLAGGIALVVIVTIRAVALWRQAAFAKSHDCGHGHGECDHGHDHAHDHGWTPAKYALLLLPVVLYFLNLPNSSFDPKRFLGQAQLEGEVKAMDNRGTFVLGFKELSNAALAPQTREELEGKTGKLKGMFSPLRNDKEFTLYRVKMTCCAADAIPLEVRMISPENITGFTPKDWVEVEGQIQFHKLKDRDKYLPVMVLKSADSVKRIAPEPEYDY